MANKAYLFICMTMIWMHAINAQTCFEDIISTSGISESYNKFYGGGVSFCDFNDDGLDDLSFATDGESSGPSFYINTGNNSFEKILLVPNFAETIKTILWVDFDNDGDKDLYYTVYDGHNRLYENLGDLEFVDVTESAGLPMEPKRSFGAIWGDVNRDGFLDLYYTSRKLPNTLDANLNRLFLSIKGETFEEQTFQYNVGAPEGIPFCAAFLDYNNDNWLDIYVSNDRYKGNKLFEHTGNEYYADVSESSGAGISLDAMCVAVGDINNDSFQDIYVTNTYMGNALLLNSDSGTFVNIAETSQTIFDGVSWGSNFLDGNNDQYLDLYASGTVVSDTNFTSIYYENLQDLTFKQIDCGLELDDKKSYSNAVGDINNDGLADIAVSNNLTHQPQLLLNKSSNQNNWLKVHLTGVKSNRDAIGAKMKVYTADNICQTFMKHCGIGFMAQNSLTDIIGVGLYTVIDSMEVLWPTGHIDKYYDLPVNQTLVLNEGDSTNGDIHIDEAIKHHYPALTDPLFTDVHESIGIDQISAHTNFMGGGCAFVDINNDGFDDLYMTSGNLPDKLYLNDQDGNFTDISESSGITELTSNTYTNGVIYADIDRDGDQDLFIMTTADENGDVTENMLLINNGQNGFTNEWNSSQSAMTLGAVFLDYDQDGWIDLYVVNYVSNLNFTYDENDEVNGFDHSCFGNRFYRNLGNGIFQDISISSKLNDTGCALAVMSSDIDNDGDGDIILANDFGSFIEPNKLYRNNYPEGDFSEIGASLNADLAIYAMGIAAADIELDGDLDYYFTNFGRNGFLENTGESFVERSADAGIDDTYKSEDVLSVGWGTAFLDYDNNLYPDLYVSNGYVPGPNFLPSELDNSDIFFVNTKDGKFEKISSELSGIDPGLDNRGMAKSDYDNDGDVDICTVSLRIPNNDAAVRSQFLRNNLANDNHWVELKLRGVISNLDAIGAKVQVHLADTILVQEIYGGSSHCSQNSNKLHFGLGTHEIIDSINIDWPSAVRGQKLYDIQVDQILEIEEDIQLVSSEDLNLQYDVIMLPNPTQNLIHIDYGSKFSEVVEVNIINTLGSIIPVSGDIKTIRLPETTGYYFINIVFASGDSITKRILKH